MSDHAAGNLGLNSFVDILLRRRWIVVAVALVTTSLTALFTFTRRPVFQAETLLLIEKERSVVQSMASGAAIESSHDDYYHTQYRLLKSDSLLERVYSDLSLDATEEFSPPEGMDAFRKAISISPVMRTRLVNVRAESYDPELATRIANSLADHFVAENLNNLLFISKEVLQALQSHGDRPEARRLQESLPAVVNNPLIQNLKADYAKLSAQAADLARRYTEKHPIRTALKSNLEALDNQIRLETDKILQSLKSELSGQLKGNNVRVVDRARRPVKPIRPRKLRSIAMATFFGIILGILAAIIIEVSDQTIRTQDDIESKLGQPFLGVIPFHPISKGDPVYMPLTQSENSVTSESFRNLRTMIDFAGINEKSRQFLVTGTLQGEGKSYVASNLAVAFAQLGESVLLIEGDMRRPRLHHNFGLASERGVSDFLASGKSVEDVETYIQKTEIQQLSVIPCGMRPPNPSELLNTPRLPLLVDWARKRYSRVIVDCTPMFPIHDTLLWGKHIGAAIVVVRFGETAAPLIRTACRRLEASGVKLLGLAVNGAKAGSLRYTAYGNQYYQYYNGYDTAPTRSS